MRTRRVAPPLARWPDPPPEGIVEITPGLWYRDSDGYRVVFDRGQPLYQIDLDDPRSKRQVCVELRQMGRATQAEIARSFGHSEVAQRRWERLYEGGGPKALDDGRRTGRHRKLGATQEACLRRWFGAGDTDAAMAERLGVSEATVRRALSRLGCRRKTATTPELPLGNPRLPDGVTVAPEARAGACEPAPDAEPLVGDAREDESAAAAEAVGVSEPEPTAVATTPGAVELVAGVQPEAETKDSIAEAAVCVGDGADDGRRQTGTTDSSPDAAGSVEDGADDGDELPCQPPLGDDPANRWLERFLAAKGFIHDVAPQFADGATANHAGALLAIPFLVQSGLLSIFARLFRTIGPAFYGLRTTVVAMFVLATLRIKRPENLKEHDAADLGRILGLDRAPEVKTLRRKLNVLALLGRGVEIMRQLAERTAKEPGDLLGILYVDGHVSEYHGKYVIRKTKVPQRGLAVPAATDTWVNDVHGDPLFVVTSEVNAGLTKMIEPILNDVRDLVGPEREITIVFDRGGWSPKLFKRLIAKGFHIITYRKGHFNRVSRAAFHTETVEVGGKVYEYQLHDAARSRVGRTGEKGGGKYVWLRQVVRLRDDGRQTAVVTDRSDLPAAMVLYLMFNRWRQENFFKYMQDEFALDAILEYGELPLTTPVDRPNPKLIAIDKKLTKAAAEVARIQASLGQDLADNEEAKRRTVRGFKIAQAKQLQELRRAQARVARLSARRDALPKRVLAPELRRLKTERRLIANAIKIVAYRAESRLLDMVRSVYSRADDEGRTLLHAAFQSAGTIHVTATDLTVTLAQQSSPHRTRAISDICDRLTALNVKFPGTELRMKFAVSHPTPVM